MKLNHVNLTVTDMAAAAQFLETYFGLRTLASSPTTMVLLDDSDLIFTLMKAEQVSYPSSFHVGFVQESKEQVDAIYQRLIEGGFEPKPPQRSHGMPGGKHAWTFYVHAPGGYLVEVLTVVD